MRKLKADEIECRVAQVNKNGFSLLLYKTARVDRAILDEEFGPMNWQNDFKEIKGVMYGSISIRNDKGEWITKWDCGTESNTEAEKGQASDCFKRAGFKWGIGVELYTAPFIWISGGTEKDEFASKKAGREVYKQINKFQKFEVKEIDYAQNGDINHLVIIDDKSKEVYRLGSRTKQERTPSLDGETPKGRGRDGVISTKPTNPDTGDNKTSNHSNNMTPPVEKDLDLLQGLYETVTTTSAEKYYKTYKDNAVLPDIFKQEYAKHYSKLKKAGK